MSDNMRIWDALSKTDPKHTKSFSRAGGFKGTATKPIWLTMRLTEKFGPCGHGWGMEKPEFQVVSAADEILVFCTVALWYVDGEKRGTVYGVGGDKVLAKRQSGSFASDEAFKASYTDALSNAMKQIGVAADIHMGLFDDSKYRDEVAREFAGAPVDVHGHPHKAAAAERAASTSIHAPIDPADRGLVQGDGRNQYETDKAKKPAATTGPLGGREATAEEARAVKVKNATDERVNFLKATKVWIRSDLDQFWTDNAVWIDWMSAPTNGFIKEYERFTAAWNFAAKNARVVELA